MNRRDSLIFFRSYILRSVNGQLDVSKLFSEDCFQQWLSENLCFQVASSEMQEEFIQALISHLDVSYGREIFDRIEREALLEELRRRNINADCVTGPQVSIRASKKRALEKLSPAPEVRLKFEESSQRDSADKKRFLSSYAVFLQFAPADETGCSRILTKECFNTWVQTRRHGVKSAEHSFRKALIAHLCGKDGRRPFPAQLEPLVVQEIRKKRVWPCFEGSSDPRILNIGNKGFRHSAFHESQLEPAMQEEELGVDNQYSAPFPKVLRRSASAREFSSMETTAKVTQKKRKVNRSLSAHDLEDGDPIDELLFSFDDGAEFPFANSFSMSAELYPPWAEEDSCLLLPRDDGKEREYSVLQTFEDVTEEEVEKVFRLRNLTTHLFEQHVEATQQQIGIDISEASDLIGDLKLLRTIRMCSGHVSEAVTAMADFFMWRRKNDIERIRHSLITEDVTLAEIKRKFSIGVCGGCFPFFGQKPNGDLIDLWVLRPQTEDDATEMEEDLRDHIVLNEYRAIAMDRLSRTLRRVVGYSVFVDCSVITTKTPVHSPRVGKVMDWFSSLRIWGHYFNKLGDLLVKWHGGSCLKLHVFGRGYLFKALSSAVFSSYLTHLTNNLVSVSGPPEENKNLLKETFGDENCWPALFGGGCSDPDGVGPAKRKLSSFGRDRKL